MGNHAVVRILLLGQEGIQRQTLHHIFVLCQIFFFRPDILHELFHKIAEGVFIGAHDLICFFAAFNIAGICSIVVLGRAAEYFRIVLPAIFADKVFQKSEIFLMLLIDCNLCFRDTALSLSMRILFENWLRTRYIPTRISLMTRIISIVL